MYLKPMRNKKILHNKPFLGIKEANTVSSVIESGWLAQGNKTNEKALVKLYSPQPKEIYKKQHLRNN